MSNCFNGDCVTCTNCFFGGKRVPSSGPEDAELVIVGESPGWEEIKQGTPFVGPSGKVLFNEIPEMISPFVTNAILCMPVNKDAKKVDEACKRCHDRLVAEISKHPRKVILALGNGALRSLTGNYNLKITQERGKLFPSELAEHGIVATVHPAFLLRGGGDIKKFRADIQYALSLLGGGGKKEPIIPEYELVQTYERAKEVLEELKQSEYIAADIETAGFNHRTDNILSVGLCGDPKKAYVFPWFVPAGTIPAKYKDGLDNDQIELAAMSDIADFLERQDVKFVWHNGKFDIKFLRHSHVQARVDEDSLLCSYALNEVRGYHDLGQVGNDTVGMPDWKSELSKHLKSKKHSYASIPRDVLNKYLAFDVSTTLQAFHVLREQVRKDALSEKLYTKTLIPASEFLTEVERTGFAFDWGRWQENKTRLEKEVAEAEAELHNFAGEEINPRSPRQVATLLYDKMRLPDKHQRSTAKEVLSKLPQMPVVIALKKHRTAAKSLSTYINGLVEHVDADNCVRSTYLLHVTPTGRLASRNPNLQNIPRDPLLKGMFVSREGYVLLPMDYNQAELRCLAALSGDINLCEIYNSSDRSLHKEVATDMYGPGYTEDQLIRAKAVNFGIPYGRDAYSIAEEFSMSNSEAQRLINAWFARFPEATDFIERCRATPKRQQTMTTTFGRKKRPQIPSPERIRGMMNEAANFPHQSIASDLTLHSGIKLQARFRSWGVTVVNIVHDELVFECPNDVSLIGDVIQVAKEEMRKTPIEWGITKIPFIAECKGATTRWGQRN